MLIRLAISRAREYEADASGARITGEPLALASALEKIGMASARIPMNVNPAFAELYIENPAKAINRRGLTQLFSTHPPIEDRIRRLREMASDLRQLTGLTPPVCVPQRMQARPGAVAAR